MVRFGPHLDILISITLFAVCLAPKLSSSSSTLHPFHKVEVIMREAHKSGKRIRVVGNALSPNGLGLSEDAMLSLGQCDRVLHVDKKKGTVTVQVRTAVWRVALVFSAPGIVDLLFA